MDRRIEVLGGFALLAGGEAIRLSARKVRAMLGLLAVARHRSMPRARLAALLWEHADAESARVSLRQALSQLRRAAGDGWVEADGDDLRLAADVSTDAEDFAAALARADDAGAVALYRGALLDGLTLGEAAAQAAIGAERTRLADLAAHAMRREMERLDGRMEATRMAHRLLAIEPLDERAHRCLMAWDAARGARRAARARFEALVVDLRREMDSAPAAETVALMDRIRRGSGRGAKPTADGPVEVGSVHAEEPERVPVLLALALEGEAPLDPAAFQDALVESGGGPAPSGPGEVAMVWRAGADLRVVAEALLAAATRSGASVGLLDTTEGNALGTDTGRTDMVGADMARTIGRARRLAARAEPGAVLVAPAVAARLGLASGTEPVALGAAPPRPEPPLVGREAELAQIDGALLAASDSGAGFVLHLSGEAGIGKTRLASEAASRAAARGMKVVRVGFAPFAAQRRPIAQEVMAALPAEADPDPTDPFAAAVVAWLRAAPLTPEAELRLSALSDRARLDRIVDVLSGALVHAAGRAGLVAVIEDHHWAPAGADDLLLELAARLAGAPITLILTTRPGAVSGLDHRLAAQARTRLLRLALAPLPADAARRLAEAAGPDRSSVEAVVERAGGHPLFLLRLLEAGWTEGALPASVTALVLEQIERLPAPEREALRRASVLGTSFDPADLAAIFPEAGTLHAQGDLLHADGAGLAFGHDLIRQAIHDALPAETRAAWHLRAADHYRSADPIRWAEHALLGGDDAETARASMAAANALIADMRLSAAGDYVEAGLERADVADGETVAELHSARAGIRRMRGALRAALDDYRAAHRAAITDETRVAMLTRQALVLHRLDRGAEADRALDAAEQLADAIGLSGLGRAEIHEQRGNRAFVTGDYAECLRQHGQSLVAAEAVGDPRGIARAHGGLGDAHFAAARMRTAFEHFDRAVTSAQRAGLGMVDQEYGFMRAYTLFFSEPGPRAHVLADLAVDAAQGAGAARAEMIARETRAEMRLVALDLDGAREDIDRLAQLLETDPESRFAADLVVLRAWLEMREGRPADAFARLEPHLETARKQSYNGAVVLSLAALAAPEASTRDAVLLTGAERLAAGALSCAALWLHAFTLERLIRDGLTDRAREQLRALRQFGGGEQLGFVAHLVRAAEVQLDGGDDDARNEVGSELAAARLNGLGTMLQR